MIFMMDLAHISLILVVFLAKVVCFKDPQAYVVHIYHHQRLSLPENGEEKQDGQFYLTVTNEHHYIHDSIKNPQGSIPSQRDKRHQQSSLEYEQGDERYDSSMEISNDESNTTYEYDYDKYKQEYYNEENTENITTDVSEDEDYEETESLTSTTTENSWHPSKRKKPIDNTTTENYCNVVLLFRIRVVQCFLLGLSENNTDLKARAGWVIAFWFLLYISTACYLWCTKGWCCCCCRCSVCQPRNVVQEAKEFLAKNPPGIMHTPLGEAITYSPEDFEMECYKDLEKDVFNF